MALTFIQQPGEISFSKNPVIVKARTSLSDKTFLRISCRVVFDNGEEKYEETYSSPVEDFGTITFNLSNASQVLFNKAIQKIDAEFKTPIAISQIWSIMLQEEWLDSGRIQKGTPIDINTEVYLVIPGGLTDYELLGLSNYDMVSKIGYANLLTRKPKVGGSVYAGETIMLPFFYTQKGENQNSSFSVQYDSDPPKTISFYQPTNKVSAIQYKVESGKIGSILKVTAYQKTYTFSVKQAQSNTKKMRFINSFGAVENISVTCNDALEYKINQEESTIFGEISFNNVIHKMSRKQNDFGVFSLSSGYVDESWAEWFTHELVMSPKAWMLIGERWVPGIITSEKSTSMYNRSKEEMQHIEFNFEMSIEGGCSNLYV